MGRADAPGQGPRLPRWDAARRLETRPLPVHAARPATERGFRDGVRRRAASRSANTEGLAQNLVHSCPPTRAARSQGGENIRIETDGDLFLGPRQLRTPASSRERALRLADHLPADGVFGSAQ